MHTHARSLTHTHARTRTHARTHAHTHTQEVVGFRKSYAIENEFMGQIAFCYYYFLENEYHSYNNNNKMQFDPS